MYKTIILLSCSCNFNWSSFVAKFVFLAFEGVTVNVLHPGSVQTNFYSNIVQPLGFIFLYIISPLFFRVRRSTFLFLCILYVVKHSSIEVCNTVRLEAGKFLVMPLL